ncbi:MAG: hypothetical protein RLY89_2468 [Bacteroidota bacterium]
MKNTIVHIRIIRYLFILALIRPDKGFNENCLGPGGRRFESCLPDQQAAAQRKLSGFFVRIPSGTSSSEGGAQKNQAAQSAAAAC